MNVSLLPAPLTEGDCAERLVAAHGDELRYSHERKTWLVWDGKRWLVDRVEEARSRTWTVLRAIGPEAMAATGSTTKLTPDVIDATLRVARCLPGISVAGAFDEHPHLFNCANGTLDLRTGSLHPHRREDYLTKVANAAYDPDAIAVRWERFLSEMMGGDDEIAAFVQRAVGRAMSGTDTDGAIVALCGSGANGKSVLLHVLRRVFGDYAVEVGPATSPAAALRSSTTDDEIVGARFLVSDGRAPSLGALERLAGSDGGATIFVASNELPIVRRRDLLQRRVHRIPLEVTIPASDRDIVLAEKLLTERTGILRWGFEGYRRWLALGLKFPAPLVRAQLGYDKEEPRAHAAAFLEERCERAPEFLSRSADLHDAYSHWCASNRFSPSSRRNLADALQSQGCVPYRTATTRGWRGIRLKDAQPPTVPDADVHEGRC